jgi:hypothetical protein
MIMGEWGIYDWVYFNSVDYKAVLTQLLNYIKSKGVEFVTWLGYGAFRTNLTATQKEEVLNIVCVPATNLITEPSTPAPPIPLWKAALAWLLGIGSAAGALTRV